MSKERLEEGNGGDESHEVRNLQLYFRIHTDFLIPNTKHKAEFL